MASVETTAYAGCRLKVPASTMNSDTKLDRPGSDSVDSPANSNSPASTGATFCTPPKSSTSREPRRLIR